MEPLAEFGPGRAAQRGATRERGRPARNHIPGWRSRSVSGALVAGSGPFGVNRTGKARGGPRRSKGSNQAGAERAEALPNMVRAGRPRSRVGILRTINRKHGLHPGPRIG